MNKTDYKDPAQLQACDSQDASMHTTIEGTGDPQLAALVGEIRALLRCSAEDQLIFTAPFIDGPDNTDGGRRLHRSINQIHGQFRRLMERIRKTLPEILAPYFC